MAKLFFRYGSMSSGKTLDLMRVLYNYEEHGKKVLIFTSAKDNRYGKNKVKSRTGLEKPAIGVTDDFNVFEYVKNHKHIDCVLVDEVQFFKKHHIFEMSDIVDKLNIPVIAYGLRSNYKIDIFEGSTYMLMLSDQIEELKTLCANCNKKAILNIRYSIKEGTCGHFKTIITEGDEVVIGGNETYMPLCRKCYKELLETTNKVKVKDISIIPEGPYCYVRKEGFIEKCPYYDVIKESEEQSDGYCHYLEQGDSDMSGGILFDQCKECGINDPDE